MAISTNGTVLARLAGGLYNETLSNASYKESVANIKTSAELNTYANETYARDFGGKTDLAVAKVLLDNLGLSAVTGLDNWVAAQLTAAGAGNKGAKVVSLLNDFANMTADTTYGSYATAFNAKTASALAFSQKDGTLGGDFSAAATADAAAAATAAAAAAAAAATAAAAAAAAEAAAAAAAAAPKSFTLSTEVDTLTGTDNADTFGAVTSTLNSGDVLAGGSGDDTLNVTLNGNPGVAELTSVETVNARLVANSSVDASLWTGVTAVNVGTTSIADTTLTMTGADFGTTFSMASGKVNGLSVTFADGSGTADTVKLSLGGLGSSTSDAAVTVAGNTTEAATITTSGTNYIDLTLGTAAKTITITGSGKNYVDVVTSATSTTVDASASTGAFDLDMASGLSAGDVLKAGAATTDKLTATVASTAALNPTISGFETIALTQSAAANINFKNVTGVTSVTYANDAVAKRMSDVPSSVTSISLQEATTALTTRVDYASGAAATTALNFAAASTATAAVAYGNVTTSNIADLTLSATGSYGVTIGTVAAGDAATSVTVKTSASTATLATGAITADELVNFTITAASGSVTVADVENDDNITLESLVINATDGADVTITLPIDAYDSGTGVDSGLETISFTGGTGSVIIVSDITAGGSIVDTGSAVAISISLGEDSGGSDIATIGTVGVDTLSITLAANAGIASEVGLITSNADGVGDVTVTLGEDAILEFDGVTAVENDIGNVTITTGARGLVSAIDGSNVDITTSTSGDVGDVTVTSGNGGAVEVEVTSAGDVGDVVVTSKADDTVIINAADTIGDVTMTVTANDTLTTEIDGLTVGNISITGAGDGASIVVKSSAGSTTATTGNITISLTGTGSVSTTVDLSDVGAAGTVSVTGGLGSDTLTGSAGADTISGGASTDTIVGGAGADTLTGGEGTDTITGGAGSDSIVLTETTAVADVVIMTIGAATSGVDSITGFGTADRIDLDLSDLNTAVGDLRLAGTFTTAFTTDTGPTFATVSAALNLDTVTTADVLVIAGDFTAATLAAALETGGTRALTANAALTAGDAFLAVYDDGTNTYVAYVTSTAGVADNATFAAGDLTVTNIVQLTGIATSTSVVSANIDIIA